MGVICTQTIYKTQREKRGGQRGPYMCIVVTSSKTLNKTHTTNAHTPWGQLTRFVFTFFWYLTIPIC